MLLLQTIYLFFFVATSIDGLYQSTISISSTGFEYQPSDDVQLILSVTISTQKLCVQQCHFISSCRLFDYDSVSQRCRLFEGDLTTGSIVSSSSSSSIVGIENITSDLYSSIHNQSCSSCIHDRYQICSVDTNSCQCPPHTYWNGLICALKLFENQTCSGNDVCRDDLNLSCTMSCYGDYLTCQQTDSKIHLVNLSLEKKVFYMFRCNP